MKRTAIGLGLGAALALGACTSTHHTSTAPLPTTSTSAPAAASPTSAPSTTTSGPSPTSSSVPASLSNSPSGPTYCATSHLAASLGPENGTAGTIYYPLTLRNIGTSSCIERGYPGVSFVGSAGDQIGAPADRQPGSISTVTLAPGGSISANLGINDSSAFPPDCNRTPVSGLRVYPPNQTAALYVAHRDFGCINTKYVTLHIYPLGYTP